MLFILIFNIIVCFQISTAVTKPFVVVECLEDGGADWWENRENEKYGNPDTQCLPIVLFVIFGVFCFQHECQSKAIVHRNQSQTYHRCDRNHGKSKMKIGFDNAVEGKNIEVENKGVPSIDPCPS